MTNLVAPALPREKTLPPGDAPPGKTKVGLHPMAEIGWGRQGPCDESKFLRPASADHPSSPSRAQPQTNQHYRRGSHCLPCRSFPVGPAGDDQIRNTHEAQPYGKQVFTEATIAGMVEVRMAELADKGARGKDASAHAMMAIKDQPHSLSISQTKGNSHVS